MANEITYKVLWVDDRITAPSYIIPFQNKAEDYDIDLCPISNWEEASKLLYEHFEEYSAIILDAECKMNASDPEESHFIHKVLPSLTSLFGKKQTTIPWYILSAGTMEDFDTAMSIAQYNHNEYEEEWGRMVYSKTASAQNENSPERLFENIKKVASNQTANKVLARYQDTFQYLGEGKLIDKEARSIMLKMLCQLHYPEENSHFEYQGNPLRKVLEHLYRAAHYIGLLPNECFDNRGQLNLLDANRYMSGLSTGHESKLRYGKEGDTIFPKQIGYITKNILNFASSDSHTSETNEYTLKDLVIDEKTKELFFGYVLQLCHVIKFFGLFVETHNNKEENLRMIKKVYQ